MGCICVWSECSVCVSVQPPSVAIECSHLQDVKVASACGLGSLSRGASCRSSGSGAGPPLPKYGVDGSQQAQPACLPTCTRIADCKLQACVGTRQTGCKRCLPPMHHRPRFVQGTCRCTRSLKTCASSWSGATRRAAAAKLAGCWLGCYAAIWASMYACPVQLVQRAGGSTTFHSQRGAAAHFHLVQ